MITHTSIGAKNDCTLQYNICIKYYSTQDISVCPLTIVYTVNEDAAPTCDPGTKATSFFLHAHCNGKYKASHWQDKEQGVSEQDSTHSRRKFF